MSIERKKGIEVVLGKFPVFTDISNIFDNLIISFLDDISKAIKSNRKFYKFPDLVQFGFWCRKPNLIKISEKYKSKNLMIGRGIVLHITPSNVPLNFAYSFVFGMLSGNTNLVRLPSRRFIQINLLCKIIKDLCKKKKYLSLKKKICFIRFKRSDEIASYFSSKADCRVIWGGDETVNQFKNYKTKLRCIDLTFPNRYSASIIDLNSIIKINSIELSQVVQRFYNDCYTMDQQGCSSPQSVIWIGKKNNFKKNKFWTVLKNIVERKYHHDLPVANKKIISISKLAITNQTKFVCDMKNFKVARIKIKNHSRNIEKIQCHFGTFAEVNVGKIEELKNTISEKFQTITYYGFKKKDIENLIVKFNIKGVDRVVPIGRAFDMSEIWDGYNIINSLSRIVGN